MAQSLTFNMDCMEAMRGFPDNFFDLAVVDPPYGDGRAEGADTHTHTHTQRRPGTASAGSSTATK